MSWPSGMRFSKSALNSCSFTQWIMGGKQKSCYGGKCTLTLLYCCWGPKENTWTPSNSGKAPCGLSWRAASGSMTMSSCSCRSTLWAEVTKLHWLALQCYPLDWLQESRSCLRRRGGLGVNRLPPLSAVPGRLVPLSEWVPSPGHQGLGGEVLHRAVSVALHMGMPFNQLGALTGSKYYDIEATYFYQRCLRSGVPFKGASWNLKGFYDHAGKRYSQLKRYQRKKLSPSQRQCWDNKRLLVSFLYLHSLLQPQRKFKATRLMALCQLVLEDFRLCLSYRPCPSDLSQASREIPQGAICSSQTSSSSTWWFFASWVCTARGQQARSSTGQWSPSPWPFFPI